MGTKQVTPDGIQKGDRILHKIGNQWGTVQSCLDPKPVSHDVGSERGSVLIYAFVTEHGDACPFRYEADDLVSRELRAGE